MRRAPLHICPTLVELVQSCRGSRTVKMPSVSYRPLSADAITIKFNKVIVKNCKFCGGTCLRTQIRTTLKKKAFEDAGIPIPPNLGRQVSSTVTSHKKVAPVPRVALVSRAAAMPLRVTTKSRAQRHPQLTPVLPPSSLGANAEVTLNMLNATENEDVDALGGDVKLEFESANDEVAT